MQMIRLVTNPEDCGMASRVTQTFAMGVGVLLLASCAGSPDSERDQAQTPQAMLGPMSFGSPQQPGQPAPAARTPPVQSAPPAGQPQTQLRVGRTWVEPIDGEEEPTATEPEPESPWSPALESQSNW